MEMNRKSLQALIVQYGGLLGVLVLLILFFSLSTGSFFQISTVKLIANQIPELTLLAVGMTLILVLGHIDLSVGSVMALSGAVLGVLMASFGWPLVAAIPISLLAGGFCGLITGGISIWFKIPSFIVSLGMLEIARGATRRLLDSNTLSIGPEVGVISQPLPSIGLSPAFLLALFSVFAAQFLLSRTVFGRYCIAIGTNAEAVRMSGIRTEPYCIAVFIISGVLCGLAGLAPTSLMEAADPGVGTGIELAAIAACVIGGTSLMGGRGNVISTFIGVLIIAVLQTGLSRMSVDDANKQIITGSVIVVAVLIDTIRRNWRSE
jgi:ribose transport system permease protein